MEPPPRIRFFYDMGHELRCATVRLDDSMAELDDILPLFAARLSTLLAKPIPPTCVTFWKLNEPQPAFCKVSTSAPLEDIATEMEMGGPVTPYVYRGEEPVSLVVQLLSPPLRGGKRAFEEADSNVVELVKRAKLATMSPSSLAHPETFITLHKKPGEPIIDHRRVYNPEESSRGEPSDFVDNLPPISILYKGFGHFLEVFRGSRHVPGTEDVESESLRLAVDDFAESMSLIYENEQVRERRGLDALDDIFSARYDDLPFVVMGTNDSIGGNSHLGYFLGQRRAAYCVAEFKNESGCGSVIPYVEMTARFAHSMKGAAEHINSASVMRGWNFPCLGLTITGHCITFYAIIFVQQWRVVSLTPGLSCIRASGDGDDRTALYNAFTAASVLLAHIQEDATKLVHYSPPIEESSHVLPPISSLRHPHSGTHIEFKLLELFHARLANSYLYSAETTDGKPIMVKLARRYSYELHMFCADRGYAPALLGFERLPGGFFCIAMEFVQSDVPISQSPHIEKRREWAEQLRELVKSFHAEDLVHGDLRDPNIICDRNRVMLIDFDWGGKEGEVSYPDGPLDADLMIGRDSTDRKITKGDDLRVLERTLKRVWLK